MVGDKGTTLLCLHKIIASSVHPILYALSSNRALSQRFPRMDKSLKAIIASFSGISSPYPHSIHIISDGFDFSQGKLGHFAFLHEFIQVDLLEDLVLAQDLDLTVAATL